MRQAAKLPAAPVKPRPPQSEAQRAARAEYMRRYRAEKGIAEPIVAAPAVPAAPAAEAPAEPEQAAPVLAATADDAAAKAKAEAESAAKLARTEKMLVEALAGTVQLVADTVQLVALDTKRPHFGDERATKVAKLWAPILAPHINESTASSLPLVLALAGTSAQVYGWANEYSAAVEVKA